MMAVQPPVWLLQGAPVHAQSMGAAVDPAHHHLGGLQHRQMLGHTVETQVEDGGDVGYGKLVGFAQKRNNLAA